MTAETRTAGRCGNCTARLNEYLKQTFSHRTQIDLLRCGDDDGTNTLRNLSAAHELCSFLDVFVVAVGAGADNDLIDLDLVDLIGGMRIFGKVRECDGRLDRGKVDLDDFVVYGIFISLVNDGSSVGALRDISESLFIYLENTVFRARFDRHVADRQTVGDGKRLCALAGEFHGTVKRTVHTDLTDDVKDDVLTRDMRTGSTRKNEFDSGGNLEPSLARCHTARHVAGADTRGECAERAVGAGVRVRADDDVTGNDETFFGKERMLYAHLSDVVEMYDFLFRAEITAHLALDRRLDILVGREMVHDHRYLFFIVNLGVAELVEFADRNGRGDVVAENTVERNEDQLARFYLIKSRVSRENFLCHCHTHEK